MFKPVLNEIGPCNNFQDKISKIFYNKRQYCKIPKFTGLYDYFFFKKLKTRYMKLIRCDQVDYQFKSSIIEERLKVEWR